MSEAPHRDYLPPSEAARRAGLTVRELEGKVSRGEVSTSDDPHVLQRLRGPGPGRPPSYGVSSVDIAALRDQKLLEMGAFDELSELRQQVQEVRTAWEHESVRLKERVADLEADLEIVLNAVEQRLQGLSIQVDADRAFLQALRARSSS